MNIPKNIKNLFREGDVDLSVLTKHMILTYTYLRLLLGFVALSFPLVLWLGGIYSGKVPELLGAISRYYHTDLNPIFMGVLIFVGVVLIIYKGYTEAENGALNIAGVLAFCIAFIPTEPLDLADRSVFTPHNICAVLFFLVIAYVAIFRAGDTLKHIESEIERLRYKKVYQVLGCAMVVLPAAVFIMSFINPQSTTIFWIQFTAIWVFGIFWILKSIEIKRSSLTDTLPSFA